MVCNKFSKDRMGGEGLTSCEVDNHRCRLERLFDSIDDEQPYKRLYNFFVCVLSELICMNSIFKNVFV